MKELEDVEELADSLVDYETLKRRLVSSGILASEFLEDSIKRAFIGSTARRVGLTSPYEPLLYETWLKQLAESLDRLLAFRREARELEIAAVKVGADYDLFCLQSLLDLDLEMSQLRLATKRSTIQSQTTVANAFSGKVSPLAEGFEAGASGLAQDVGVDLLSCDDEVKLLQDRQTLVQSFQDAYFTRTTQLGNAHNYKERFLLLQKLIDDELDDAYLLAVAIASGINQVYGSNLVVPNAAAVNFLDDLVFWCRRVMRSHAIASQMETEFEIVIPLVQPISPNAGLVSAPTFSQAINPGPDTADLDFKLPADMFDGLKVRTRRIGASYGNAVSIIDGADLNAINDSYARYRMVFSTPPQGGPVALYNRPPVRLGVVSLFGGPAALCYSDGPECTNIDPIGDWSVSIDRHPVYKDDSKQSISTGIGNKKMLDLKLHLRLRTIGTFPPL